ncbi:MAG: cobyrinic acid a,c-diamide synthase [Peptococcaceae bacterium BICA1-8]|nr:MAG: cobyrinic acid a,c-diamide synthase [Peptococcaceae bacterium BICA1-8]
MLKIPRLVVGACQGRSGKTTFTLGLLQALKDRGTNVQPFKKGPDYIDPSWLSYAAGKECRNLDAFMMDKDNLVRTFINNSRDKEISVVEGAMGLFDGLDLEGTGSTAEVAYMIQAPVILVVNCQRMTRSVAALVNGVVNFDPRIKIGGVILNNVARSRHENMLTAAIEKYCQVPVVGILPKSSDIEIPDRHLGLIPATEKGELVGRVAKLGKLVSENVDIDKILEIAQNAPDLQDMVSDTLPESISSGVNIGVIRDKVFSFYYPENLEALERQGAELVFINSLVDNTLPQIDALYIGGGFPEMFAKELEENKNLRGNIKNAIEEGLPVYAECGGLMYLGRRIIWADATYDMVGTLPFDINMEKKPQGHGYTINRVREGNPYLPCGLEIRGHEFHNSKLINLDSSKIKFGLDVKRGKGITGKEDGIVYKNVFASYSHLHATSVPQWAEGLVNMAKQWKSGYLS